MKQSAAPLISIPAPCPQNWQDMTPTENGRHCQVCHKEVRDFTNMTSDEIRFALNSLQETKVCGRFRSEHVVPDTVLKETRNRSSPIISSLNQLADFRPIRFVFLWLAGTVLGSCQKTITGEPAMADSTTAQVTQAKMVVPPTTSDTGLADTTIKMGEMIAPQK